MTQNKILSYSPPSRNEKLGSVGDFISAYDLLEQQKTKGEQSQEKPADASHSEIGEEKN